METKAAVSFPEWIKARKALLEQEKAFSRQRDALSQARRDMPWCKVEKEYVFQTSEQGETTSLAGLFGDTSQLIVQHFMFGADWDEGCTSCSFWADGYNGFQVHLKHRDATMVTVSKAPLKKLHAYRDRMGWSFEWVSSMGSDFNNDFNVTFSEEETKEGEVYYNYKKNKFPSTEAPGISIFYKNRDGDVFHTYSCYSRGLDMMNACYHYIDLLPKGRDEKSLTYGMAWLRRHDDYPDDLNNRQKRKASGAPPPTDD